MNNDYQSLAPELRERLKMMTEGQVCRTVEEVRKLLDFSEKGQVKNSMENVYRVFMSDPMLHGAIGYNILTGRIDICKPLWWERNSSGMSDTDFNYLMLYLESRYGLNHENRIRKALTVVAHQNRYHPIRDYLQRLEWDGTERIRYVLHRFLGAEVSDYTYEVMKLFLLGAISRVFHPGCKFELMLCLVGGQGAGKSAAATVDSCRSWYIRNKQRFIFWKMKQHPGGIWISCGQRR